MIEQSSVPITVTIPLDSEFLNRQLQASAEFFAPEDIKIPNFRLTFFVAADKTIEVPFLLDGGYVCTRRSPLLFESNYYHVNITVDVFVGDKKINPYPMPLTHPFEVDFGIYYVKRTRVNIIITNKSKTGAEITFQVVPNIIRQKIYETWYMPLIRKSYELLKKIAKE